MRCSTVVLFLFCVVTVPQAEMLLYQGHISSVGYVRKSGNYLLSCDGDPAIDLTIGRTRNWTLWNYVEKKRIINGTVQESIDLQGTTMAVMNDSSFLIYNLPDTIPIIVKPGARSMLKVTADGEFICFQSAMEGFKIWDRLGNLKYKGIYKYNPDVASVPGKLIVAVPGEDSIVSYPVPSFQNPTVIKFAGSFECWLKSGETFLARQGSVARVYGVDGASRGLFDLGNSMVRMSGGDSYSWTFSDSVRLYKNDSVNVSLFTMQAYVGWQNFVKGKNYFGFVTPGIDTLVFCRINKSSVEVVKKAAPQNPYFDDYDCDSAGNWVLGTRTGLIFCGNIHDQASFAPINVGCIRGISGCRSGKIAISTSTDKVMLFDLGTGKKDPVQTINLAASTVRLSADGSRLFAQSLRYLPMGNDSGPHLTAFSFASGSVIDQWTEPVEPVDDFTVSADGTVVGRARLSGNSGSSYATFECLLSKSGSDRQVVFSTISGSVVPVPQVSPSGRFVAVQDGDVVKLFRSDTLVNAFNGKTGGWINDTSLIINRYDISTTSGGRNRTFRSAAVFGVQGDSLPRWKLPGEVRDVYMISDTVAFFGATSGTSFEYFPLVSGVASNRGYSVFPQVMVADLRSGKTLYTVFNTTETHGMAFPVGSEFIVREMSGALELVNWREKSPVMEPRRAQKNGEYTLRLSMTKNRIQADFTLSRRESPTLQLFSLRGVLLGSVSLGSFGPGFHRVDLAVPVVAGGRLAAQPSVALLRVGGMAAAHKILWQGDSCP